MNRMRFEQIKHEEAKKAADRSGFDWTDLLDNTRQYEEEAKHMSEKEMRDYWRGIFEDTVSALTWEG